MCEKLFTLCDLQLGAIVTDLEKSVESVNAAASNMMRSVTNEAGQHDAVEAPGSINNLTTQLGNELRKIIMGLQFHDELTQRLNHVQDLLKLLQDQSDTVGKKEMDNDALLSVVSGIFSSNAEFKELGKVFPGYEQSESTDAIELF